MNRIILKLLLAKGAAAVSILLTVYPSLASDVSFNLYGAFLDGNASRKTGYGPYAGIILAKNSTSSIAAFSLSFVAPEQSYPSQDDLRLDVIWHSESSGCSVELRRNFLSVARPPSGGTVGQHLISPGPVTDGLQAVRFSESEYNIPKETEVFYVPVANRPMKLTYSITNPINGEPLSPGDAINFGFFRSNSPRDTCTGNVVIQGIRAYWVAVVE